MDKIEEQEKRIAALFQAPQPPNVDDTTLTIYRDYLQAQLHKPCQVTGIEAFSWEERYVFTSGNNKAYEQERKTRASSKDIFELVGFDPDIDDFYGILAQVRRNTDQRVFELPLSDLQATERSSPNYELLDDYSSWFVNYR